MVQKSKPIQRKIIKQYILYFTTKKYTINEDVGNKYDRKTVVTFLFFFYFCSMFVIESFKLIKL